ncbi:MAG: HEAT repeat domain-containing protein, partial [Planctomycetales bacterium]|nr:HEAT repeat domain-containing protein [Planctomycetales bacterium]
MSAKGCLAILGVVVAAGGGVGGWFVLRARQVQASVDGLAKFHPPAEWADFTMSSKAAAPIRAVRLHGSAAVKGLLQALDGPAGPARQGAMVALGDVNEPAAVATLVKTIQGEDPAEAAAAAYALSRFKTTPPEVAALLQGSPTSQVRKSVYWALARSPDKESQKIVAQGIEDREGDVRYFAVQALATIRGKSAVAALVKSLADEDRTVASAAADALAAREADVPRDDVRALAQSGPAAARARAISVLARIGDGQGRPVAIAAVQDPDPEVAAAGAALLATCRAKEEGGRLVALLERPEKEVVAAAERALRDLK